MMKHFTGLLLLILTLGFQPGAIFPEKNISGEINRNQALNKLRTLPYLSGYKKASEKSGVVKFNRALVSPGVNLYISGQGPAAYLLDMDGVQLHEWRMKKDKDHPELAGHHHFRKVYLYPNGDILAICEGTRGLLVKLDKDSNLLWSFTGDCPNGGPHHDLEVASDGKIFLIASRMITDLNYKGFTLDGPIMEDYITVLTPGGKEVRSISLIDCFRNSDYTSYLKKMRLSGDVFHTNTIEILTGAAVDTSPILKSGRALISIPFLDTIAVVDMDEGKVTWAEKEIWKAQHDPSALRNGNILIFDNRGGEDDLSRVIEFNPVSGDIVWSYQRGEPEPFLSETCGTAQRLPDGNTLITDTESGRAFEVTPKNKIVWDFYNPHRTGENGKLIASLFELIRLSPPPTFIKKKSE